MGRWRFLLAVLFGALALVACTAKEETTPATTAPEAKPAWEQEWERVLAAAKQEGKVGVISSFTGAEARKVLTDPFEKKYGITVEYMGLKGGEIGSRLESERRAGQYLWDVGIGGTTTHLDVYKPLGALDPIEPTLILPEVKEGKNWLGGKLEFADAGHLSLVMMSYSMSNLFVNTAMVKAEEFKTYKDLLDPKWKGKIEIHDPRIAGPGNAMFTFFYQHKELGPDFIRNLAKQDLMVLRDTRQELEWLGQGKYPLCIACSTESAQPLIQQGVPITRVNPTQLKEGGYLSAGAGAVGLVNRAPHPNAAKVYLNWLLSRDTQSALARASEYGSRRLDVPNQEWLEPWQLPNANFWPAYDEPAIALKTRLDPFLEEVFGK